jgi:hypothetical protein
MINSIEVLELITLSFFITLASIYFILYYLAVVRLKQLSKKINELFKKNMGKSLFSEMYFFNKIGLKITLNLFYNEYKNDKYYNKLIWGLRIITIIFITLLILF